MTTLTYTIDINAPRATVWDIMLADATYRQWTSAFQAGSYYEGGWNEGDKIRFLSEEDGEVSGMSSRIVENKLHEYISIEHLGEVVDGEDMFDTEGAKAWAGGRENYHFTDHNGGTRLVVTLESAHDLPDDIRAMFDEMWPPALQKLQQITETR